MLAALLPGWVVLGRCRFGTAGPVGEAKGCHALAHPAVGIALVDVVPDVTPNAEARLRRALNNAGFWPAFHGTLPIWHGRIEPGEVRLLPAILAEGFSTLPPLTVPGRAAWMAAVQDALAEDLAWEVPGRSPRALPPPLAELDEDEDADPPPRRRGRMVLAAAFAGVCGLGLAGGLLLWTDAPSSAAADAATPPPVLAAALPEPALPPIERVTLPVLAPLALPAAEAVPALSEPVLEPPPLEAPMEQPAEQIAAEALPAPPPQPPPPRRVTAPRRPRIDPGCSTALFRFQQGLPVSATDAAHIRNGCATRY